MAQAETKQELDAQLKETLEQMPHIEEIHYDAKGNHYFNVHEHKGKKYFRIPSIPGEKNGKKVMIAAPEDAYLIVKTVKRKDILSGKSKAEATDAPEPAKAPEAKATSSKK